MFISVDIFISHQELLLEKDEGASRVHEAVEQGEKLFPNTAAEGRDIIRQEIRCGGQNLMILTDDRATSPLVDLGKQWG